MTQIKFRRDSASRWRSVNPVLADGEPGVERDTGRFKIGNGSARWLDLEYFVTATLEEIGVSQQDLLDHIDAAEPHPVYDDGPSLYLLYENAKV